MNTIATAIVAIIAVLAFFKDELLKPPSPQFKIKNFQTAPDSVIIIIAQNETASRNSALNVEFDGRLFPTAGQVISKSNPRQWAFRLKDNNPLASQIEDGEHVLRVGFPGDALLPDRLYIIFKTNDDPQFGIKNLNTHPDSAIVIIWRNKGVTRLIPLNVEFDEKLFVEAGQAIPDSQPQQWSFRLKKHNPPAALLRNGLHRMRVGFPGKQYSDSFVITFAAKALPESIVVQPQNPEETSVYTAKNKKPNSKVKPLLEVGGPVKPVIKKLAFPTLDSNVVKVSLERNGSDPISKDYIDRTAFILTTLNQHYYADSLKVWSFSSLNDNATTASLAKFSRTFLTKGAYVSKSQIIVPHSEKENHVVLGPITIFFNTDKTAKSLYLIFNQERKPKLTDIRLE